MSSVTTLFMLLTHFKYLFQLTYLGPPFNEKDFSPPRPNSTALTLPSAATRLELWHGLENQARLAQNQKAYSVLLAAVRELARSTLCPSLKTSLLHFCTGLDGLLGSISALMTTLGYALPPQSAHIGSNAGERGAGGNRPAPLMSQSLYRSRAGTRPESGLRSSQRRSGTKEVRGERDAAVTVDLMEKKRGKDGRRAEVTTTGGRNSGLRDKGKGDRGRREKREEPVRRKWTATGRTVVMEEEEETWGRRRRLLSISVDGEEGLSEVSYTYNLNAHYPDSLRQEDGFIIDRKRDAESSVPNFQHRFPRSIVSPTFQPPLSTLSLLYQFGASEEHTLLPQTVPLSLRRGTSLLSPPLSPLFPSSSLSSSSSLLSVRPTMNDFARKVEGFWILRELQSWLWRSAKDFNRLKKRLRG